MVDLNSARVRYHQTIPHPDQKLCALGKTCLDFKIIFFVVGLFFVLRGTYGAITFSSMWHGYAAIGVGIWLVNSALIASQKRRGKALPVNLPSGNLNNHHDFPQVFEKEQSKLSSPAIASHKVSLSSFHIKNLFDSDLLEKLPQFDVNVYSPVYSSFDELQFCPKQSLKVFDFYRAPILRGRDMSGRPWVILRFSIYDSNKGRVEDNVLHFFSPEEKKWICLMYAVQKVDELFFIPREFGEKSEKVDWLKQLIQKQETPLPFFSWNTTYSEKYTCRLWTPQGKFFFSATRAYRKTKKIFLKA